MAARTPQQAAAAMPPLTDAQVQQIATLLVLAQSIRVEAVD